MTNGAVGEPSRESLHRGYSIAIKRIFSWQHLKTSPTMGLPHFKYASENGNSTAIKHFKVEIPNLKEGTVRTFKQAYQKIKPLALTFQLEE